MSRMLASSLYAKADLCDRMKSFRCVLEEMSTAGYVGSTFAEWAVSQTESSSVGGAARHQFDMFAILAPIPFVHPDIREWLQKTLKTAELLSQICNQPFIVLCDQHGTNELRIRNAGRIRPEFGLNSYEWKTFARNVNMVARLVLEHTGVKSVFRHHCASFVETPLEVERLLGMTDELLVGLCLDTGHYTFGGGDPVAALRAYQERIWHIQIKDFDAQVWERARQERWSYFNCIAAGIFCELGKGTVDYPVIADELRRQRYSGWIVLDQNRVPE